MTYAQFQEIPGDWATYEKINAELGDVKAPGLIVHVAGPSANGVTMIDVWESKDAYDRFGADRLFPAMQALGLDVTDALRRDVVEVQHDLRP